MSEQKIKKDNRGTLAILRDGLKHLLLHNGWLKLIAILISVVLWAGLISQDESITRDKTFQDARVSVIGTEVMKNNGFILATDLDGLTADFTAAVPQKQYEAATASVYNVRVDLSRINQSGPQEIQLDKSYSNVYGKVTSITPSTITVDVEKYKMRPSIPLSAKLSKPEPEGYYFDSISVLPNLLTISGPESIVNEVSYARAYIDTDEISWIEGEDYRAFKFKLYNKSGEEIDSSRLSITSSNIETDSVVVSYNILPKKTFSTQDLFTVTGIPCNGYKISDVRIIPESITVTDISDVLDSMDSLIIDKDKINITGAKESVTSEVHVIKPTDDAVLSNEIIKVIVDIEPADEP